MPESIGGQRDRATSISVVIASNRDPRLLAACIDSIRPACARLGAQLVVARGGRGDDADRIRSSFPDVHVVEAAASALIPELRAAGLDAATGDVVALTEDHVVADPNWLDELLAVAGGDVLGGAIDNAQRARAIDWGAYFAEYGVYADTRPEGFGGQHSLLTAANVAYRRSVVTEVARWARAGAWENVAHDRLQSSGHTLRFVRGAVVRQNNRYRISAFCADRFEHGYTYARTRLIEERDRPRALLLCVTPALPFLLTWRVGTAAAPTRWGAFLRALPFTFAFLAAWSFGEAVGYWRGPAVGAAPRSLSPTA